LHSFAAKNLGVEEFWATVTPGNEASKRLLLKNNYVEVSDEKLPRLTSYDSGDWVFFRSAKESFDGR
ncbi:MAG: N-acetyltransferase, partial [Cyanobacteria bacterium J06598_4]